MVTWLSRVFLAGVLLGALAAAPAMAQNGRGQSRAPELPDAARSGAGVPQAGETVVLRPSGPVPDQYIVVLRDDVTNPRGLANALARQNGLALRGVYTRALKGFAARMPEAVAQRLALDPAVAYVEQDLYAQADVLVTGVDRIDADENAVANINNRDEANSVERVDVDVAVIDTGIDGQHGDLNVHALFNCIGGCGGALDPTTNLDDNGHGTHVAGSIGALDNGTNGTTNYEVVGVAPGARLWGFKVLDSGGSGSFADVIAAIDAVTANAGEIEVANMSLSGVGFLDSSRTAIQNSVAAGVVYVVAAGNAQQDVYGKNGVLDTAAICKGLFCRNADDTIPAAYPEVMTVSALAEFDGVSGGLTDQTVSFSSCTHTGDDVFACFTNFSGSVDGSNPVNSPGAAIDVAGPGVSIVSTWRNDSYAQISGTSMASPHVAGAVAVEIVAAGGRPVDANQDFVYAIRQAMIDGAQPQSEWGPADTKDPDANPEGLVYVGVGDAVALDVAITSVDAPSPVLVDSTETVSVDVSNNGTDEVTVSISLNDADVTVDVPHQVTLASGAAMTVDFSWTPTATGNHTLTATHDLVDDENTVNDSASTSVSVTDPIIDAAVTSIDAPSPVDVNTAQTVTVGVANNSTQQETISVALTDDTFATDIGAAQDVVLDAGASTTLDFSWTPTQTGDHELMATASLTADADTGNNSMTTVSTVSEPGVNALAVDSVCYFGEGGRTSDKHLNSRVAIDDGSVPVGGVTVDATLTDTDTNETRSGTGTTDSNGEVIFAWKNAASGNYTTTVNAVNGTPDGTTDAPGVAWPDGNNSCTFF